MLRSRASNRSAFFQDRLWHVPEVPSAAIQTGKPVKDMAVPVRHLESDRLKPVRLET